MKNNLATVSHFDGKLIAILRNGVLYEIRMDLNNSIEWCSVKTVIERTVIKEFEIRGIFEQNEVIESYIKLCMTYIIDRCNK